jgi:hypothetical protein
MSRHKKKKKRKIYQTKDISYVYKLLKFRRRCPGALFAALV